MAKKKGEYDPWNADTVTSAAEQEVDHDAETGEILENANGGDDVTSSANTIAVAQLRAFIERIEHEEAEKETICDGIKEIYAEAKGSGFDPKTIRRIVKLRKMDDTTRHEAETMLQLYMDALGMDGGTIV
jgi:uncharacterized protein (UPF0335 family)